MGRESDESKTQEFILPESIKMLALKVDHDTGDIRGVFSLMRYKKYLDLISLVLIITRVTLVQKGNRKGKTSAAGQP